MSRRNLFIGYSWGSSGSHWLAHVLNAHFDVFCMNSVNFPGVDNNRFTSVARFIANIFQDNSAGGSFDVVGFTHAVQPDWHDQFQEIYGDQLKGFFVERHPINRINSNFALHLNALPKRKRSLRWQLDWMKDYHTVQATEKNASFPSDAEHKGFYRSCLAVNRVLNVRKKGLPTFLFEDLTVKPEAVNNLLRYVSDDRFVLEPGYIAELQRKTVSGHAKNRQSAEDIYNSWSDIQRKAYTRLFDPEAFAVYKGLGYEFPHADIR